MQIFVVDIFNHFCITSVERFGNHFIALNTAEDVGSAKRMRSVADKSEFLKREENFAQATEI